MNLYIQQMRRNINRKCTVGHVRLAQIQISLRIPVVWTESSLGAFWIASQDAKFLHVDKEDSDQAAWMCRLIWVFVWCTSYFFSLLAQMLV